MKKPIIFDIDGTLARIVDMAKLPAETMEEVETFKRSCAICEPICDMIDMLQALHESGERIIFLTARPHYGRGVTTAWLYSHIPFLKHIDLIMRTPSTPIGLVSDEDFKIQMLLNHGLTSDKVKFLVDDNDNVVASLRGAGYNVVHVHDKHTIHGSTGKNVS